MTKRIHTVDLRGMFVEMSVEDYLAYLNDELGEGVRAIYRDEEKLSSTDVVSHGENVEIE